MSRTVSVLVLCEDAQARVFILDALEAADPALVSRVRVIPCPGQVFRSGEGGTRSVQGWTIFSCGSQHVRENYPKLVEQRRSQEGRLRAMGCRLVVHVDVDNADPGGRTVNDRMNELREACKGVSVHPPEPAEPVAHLIPRRNIETWIRFFHQGPPVDEHTDYGHLPRESAAAPAAANFGEHAARGTVPAGAPPSLVLGLAELRKIL